MRTVFRNALLVLSTSIVPVLSAAAEPLNGTEFAFEEIWFWHNAGGEPGEERERINVAALDKGRVTLVDWSDDYEMMLIDFGQGQGGWVKKADLIPPASTCQRSGATRATGGNTKTIVLASRGLAEKACE